jgi:hypothetical protein
LAQRSSRSSICSVEHLGLFGLHGDIGGQLGEVDSGLSARSPQLQGFLGGGHQHGGMVLAPGAAGVTD